MSTFILILIIINITTLIAGLSVGGAAWIISMIAGFIVCALLHCKSLLFFIPLGLGILAGSYVMFIIAFIVSLLNYLSILFILNKES